MHTPKFSPQDLAFAPPPGLPPIRTSRPRGAGRSARAWAATPSTSATSWPPSPSRWGTKAAAWGNPSKLRDNPLTQRLFTVPPTPRPTAHDRLGKVVQLGQGLAAAAVFAGLITLTVSPVGASIIAAGMGVSLLASLPESTRATDDPYRQAERMAKLAGAVCAFTLAVTIAASGFTPVGWALAAVVGAAACVQLGARMASHRDKGLHGALMATLKEMVPAPIRAEMG